MTAYTDGTRPDPMLEFDGQLDRLRELVSSLTSPRSRVEHNPVEVISDNRTLRQLFDRLQNEARNSVRILDRPPYLAPPPAQADLQLSRMRAGVIYRGVYATEVLDNPRLTDITRRLARAGEQARLLPQVPMKVAIADADLALIAMPEEPDRHLAVRRSGLLDGIIAMFEMLWGLATPQPGSAEPGTAGGRRAYDREVLLLLAAGATDDAIARHLGISLRTAQRRVRALLDSLSAQTRFQAGIQAARRNWL